MALDTLNSDTDIQLKKNELNIDTMSTTSPQYSEDKFNNSESSDMEDELFSFSQIPPNDYVDDISDILSPKTNLLQHALNTNKNTNNNLHTQTHILNNINVSDMSQESGLSITTPVPVRRRENSSDTLDTADISSSSHLDNIISENINMDNISCNNTCMASENDFDIEFHMCSQSSDTTVCDPYKAPNPWKKARKQHMRSQRQIEAVRQILTGENGLQVIQETSDDWEEGQITSE